MMAFDSRSTPEPRTISEATHALLAEAVLGVWNDPALWHHGAEGPQPPPVSAAMMRRPCGTTEMPARAAV